MSRDQSVIRVEFDPYPITQEQYDNFFGEMDLSTHQKALIGVMFPIIDSNPVYITPRQLNDQLRYYEQMQALQEERFRLMQPRKLIDLYEKDNDGQAD